MESETFQETMQWLRKKHKKDRAQVRERQNELKELTFRISKRLDGTFSSPVAKKYRPLSMDVGILSSSTRNVIERRSPLKNSASARNSGLLNNSSLGRRSIVNSKRRRRRRNRVTLSQLSLDMSSSNSKILNEFPDEGTSTAHASKTFGYKPKRFPDLHLSQVSDDGRPRPYKRLKPVPYVRPKHVWEPSGPATYTPTPVLKKDKHGNVIRVPYEPPAKDLKQIKLMKRHAKRVKRTKPKYMGYKLPGVSSACFIGERLLKKAKERRGVLQDTYDKLNDAAIKLTKFFRNGRGIALIWKWKRQMREVWFYNRHATVIIKWCRRYLANKRIEIMHTSAIRIQCLYRSCKAHKICNKKRKIKRAKAEFRDRMLRKRAARILQRNARKRIKVVQYKRMLGKMALNIQRRARGWMARKKTGVMKKMKQKATAMATAIQKRARGFLQRRFNSRKKEANSATKIQAVYRGRKQRKKEPKRKTGRR